ncbi:MAG: malate synthase [Solirubrobacteraceae bacterium]|jgi:malate synthase|nr:malate synthase [Solirubrobacteraceae bacterium]
MRVEIAGPMGPRYEEVLTADALDLVALLHEELDGRRRELLAARAALQAELDRGGTLDFPRDTADVREGDWTVPPAPPVLADRRVEITGPTDRKMVINALNSGAAGFMADFEDANSPTWDNMVSGQVNLMDAVRGTIEHTNPDGAGYTLEERTATLHVRPRGWHLPERHLLMDGEPVAGALFDFALFLFHNAHELLDRGAGPFFYLPKLESRHEAALWNDAFEVAQEALGLQGGTIRATVLVETMPAAFEMDEILWALGPHATALNAGRWDYIFSAIKRFRSRPEFVLPDRARVTMTVPFMRAYTERLVATAHRRGAHAMGGMAAVIPSRSDEAANQRAFAAVRDDKRREAAGGFDGTWVAHPDSVGVAREAFDAVLGERPNQLERRRDDVRVTAADLLAVPDTPGEITEAGLRGNVGVGIRYVAAWLRGSGAVAIDGLMEDAATAEIARGQVWQWVRHSAALADGRPVTAELVRELAAAVDDPGPGRRLFEEVALGEEFVEFLTLPGYERLED